MSEKRCTYAIHPETLEEKARWVERSGAAELLDRYFEESRGQGGRTSEWKFSMLGYLTIKAALMAIPRAASDAEALRVMRELTVDQLERLGMVAAVQSASDKAFYNWIARRLRPVDPGFDLPARRVTNAEHRRHVRSRTPEVNAAVHLAADRLHTVVNLLVAASVDDLSPEGARGDIVIDETVIDLAGQSDGLGSRDDKLRGAAYMGAYYVRDRVDNSVSTAGQPVKNVKRAAFGIGVTAVTRVGDVDDLYGVAPVITGIAIHTPTSASIEGASRAIQAHQDNGFAHRKSRRARMPYLTVDMGYNQKRGFSDLCLDRGYSPVVRYPKNWRLVWASAGAEHVYRGVPAGPVQIAGDFYCPAAAHLAKGAKSLVRKTVDILEDSDGFERHDRQLAALLPLLMGTNSRPYRARAQGRPRNDAGDTRLAARIDLVCPAVQGRVRCPLKPESMAAGPGATTITPTWNAEDFRCCAKSQVTVKYSREQWRMATWGLTPGSWEHAAYFEAARALTEQRFSMMKSVHVTGISDLRWSGRREPGIALLVALWIASTNRAIQDSHARRTAVKQSSIKRQLARIEEDLGRPPFMIPPRT